MQKQFSPEDRHRTLRQLAHGMELAQARPGKVTPTRVIWALLEEAVEVVEKLPDQERRWLTSGFRSGGWNAIGLSAPEAEEIERLRFLSAMKPYDGPTKAVAPQRDDTERALDVMGWLQWCHRASDPRTAMKACVALARGGEAEIVYRILFPGRKVTRQAVTDFKARVAGWIQRGLREEAGIAFNPNGTFEEYHA